MATSQTTKTAKRRTSQAKGRSKGAARSTKTAAKTSATAQKSQVQRVAETGGLLLESAGRQRAHAGVEARDDAEDLALAGEVGELAVPEVRAHQLERRGRRSDRGEAPVRVGRMPIERDRRHAPKPSTFPRRNRVFGRTPELVQTARRR